MPRRSRLRVLHAAPYLWSGAGNVITRLVEMQAVCHDVALVTSPAAGGLRNWPAYERRVARTGSRRQRVDLFHRDAASLWTAVQKMRGAIDDFRPDILHAHAGTPTAVLVLARAASSRPATPVVSHFYSWGLGRPAWMNEMDLWALAQADTVICSARGYRARLLEGGVAARRLRLIPWGLEVSAAAGTRTKNDPPVIGTLGRIERRKGQLDLIEAFVRVRERWPAARLEIVGPVAEEAYAASIRASIARHRLGRAVRMMGHVREPGRYLARWSTYVSLSSDEGQGLAILEAMAHGVPVVALRAAGVEDYLAHEKTGLSVASRSARAVAHQVGRLFSEPDLAARMSASARSMVRRAYSWDGTVRAIEAIYARHLR